MFKRNYMLNNKYYNVFPIFGNEFILGFFLWFPFLSCLPHAASFPTHPKQRKLCKNPAHANHLVFHCYWHCSQTSNILQLSTLFYTELLVHCTVPVDCRQKESCCLARLGLSNWSPGDIRSLSLASTTSTSSICVEGLPV